jgi:AraC family transcriptional regulator
MRVAVDVLGAVGEPYLEVDDEHVLGMLLRPGFIEMGLRRSAIRRVTFQAGEIRLCTPHSEQWFGSADLHLLTITISDGVLTAARNGTSREVELRSEANLEDARVRALVAAVNAERVAGFPSGRLFLDSVEQALGLALVAGYGVGRPSLRIYRGGLSPARLRRVTELVHAKIDDDLTLEEMAESAELSIAHFSQMFRASRRAKAHTSLSCAIG